jgi:hypothetical protein
MSTRSFINTLLVSGLLALLALGCTLAPDDTPREPVFALQIAAVVDDPGKSARADLVDDVAYLSGRARIWSLPAELPEGCQDVCDEGCAEAGLLLADGPLAVTVDEESAPPRLILSGDVSFDLDSPGSRYRLEVALLERGRRIEGDYAGDLVLDSGLEALVDSLHLSAVLPDDYTIEDLVLCLDTDLVELDPADRCVDETYGIAGTWDRELNELVIVYERGDVEIEGSDSDSVQVRLNAALQPAPIYAGCTELEFVAVGDDPVAVTLTLTELADSGPGLAGEILAGDLVMGLYGDDGAVEIAEHGILSVIRTESLPAP